MAPMFYIHITQGQNLVSLQAAPHTGYIGSHGIDKTGLGYKCITPFEYTYPACSRGYRAGHGTVGAVHMAFSSHRDGDFIADGMDSHCQGSGGFISDILAAEIGDIPHILHLYSVHAGLLQYGSLLQRNGNYLIHSHVYRVIFWGTGKRP